jgi:hypothetical protein
MTISVNTIFGQGQPLGHIVNLFTPLLVFQIRNSYELSPLHQQHATDRTSYWRVNSGVGDFKQKPNNGVKCR